MSPRGGVWRRRWNLVRPDWLAVPAASDGGRHGRGGGRLRVVLFVTDRSHHESMIATLDGDVAPGLPRHADCDIEMLDAGNLGWSESVPDWANLGSGVKASGQETQAALDTHRLDVALSTGRHAVERARLAGCVRVIGVGQRAPMSLMRALQAGKDPYDALRRWGEFETAALTGMVIAGAQIGLQVRLHGRAARPAALAATALHPDIGNWLSISMPDWTDVQQRENQVA